MEFPPCGSERRNDIAAIALCDQLEHDPYVTGREDAGVFCMKVSHPHDTSWETSLNDFARAAIFASTPSKVNIATISPSAS